MGLDHDTIKFGLSLPERRLLWAPYYASVLEILGTTGLIVPIGDTQSESAGLTTATTRGGEQAVFTYSDVGGRDEWDSPASDLGPAHIPVISFNGSDEVADSPDAAYWSGTADGTAPNEPAFSLGMWINPSASLGWARLFAREDITSGSTEREFRFFGTGSGGLGLHIYDESSGGFIGRKTANSLITTGAWFFVTATKSTGVISSAVKIYIDGVNVDNADDESGSYTAMENTDAVAMLVHRITTTGAVNALFNGKMAGGPLGPFFTQVVLTADQILRLYQLHRVALGV